jgi:malate permease and related proteins
VSNLVLLVLCFFVGVLARRARVLPEDSHRAVNAWVMFVSLPALVFRSIHGAKLDAAMWFSSALLWLVFVVPAFIASWHLRKHPAQREAAGALALTAGLCNTAFVGLPLLEAVAGKDALGPAAVVDQLGGFLALFLFAMPWAASVAGQKTTTAQWAKKLTRSPALVALALAIALHGVEIPVAVDPVLHRLADMLSPLALASIGWQLDLSALAGNGKNLALGLAWKLVLAPAMVLGVLLVARGALTFTDRIVVAQAAMAPMVTAGVVAADHRLSPGLASAMIAVGVPLSLITVPLWWRILEGL